MNLSWNAELKDGKWENGNLKGTKSFGRPSFAVNDYEFKSYKGKGSEVRCFILLIFRMLF